MAKRTDDLDVRQDRVQQAILEYLKHYEFVHSAECLEAEIERKTLSEKSRARHPKRKDELSVTDRILTAFDKGDEDVFVFLWNTKVSERDRDTDLARHIEFDVRLYIAVFYVLSKGTSAELETEARMRSLKKFLDTRGRFLSKDPACCSFYALPLCAEPYAHPVFAQLFTDSWRDSIRQKLTAFLDLNAREGTQPELCNFYSSNTRGQAPAGRITNNINSQRKLQECDSFSAGEKESKMRSEERNDYSSFIKALYATTIQSVELLHQTRRMGGDRVAKLISEKYMNKLMRKVQHFGDLIDAHRETEFVESDLSVFTDIESPRTENNSQNIRQHPSPRDSLGSISPRSVDRDNERNPARSSGDQEDYPSDETKLSLPREALSPERPIHGAKSPQSPKVRRSFQVALESPVMAPLDFQLIKSDLDQLADRASREPMAIKQGCFVLQALRWRISRNPNAQRRAHAISIYIEHDLLGIRVGDGERTLLKALLTSDAPNLVEYTIRLLSYIAIGHAGRTYLMNAKDIVLMGAWNILNVCKWKFPRENSSSPEAALCLLQRLSLEPSCSAAIHELPLSLGGAAPSKTSIVAFLVDILSHAQRRGEFINEHIAALALNLSIVGVSAQYVEREEDCLLSLEAVLAEPSFDYLHQYAVGIYFALLRSPKARAALCNQDGPHFAMVQDLINASATVDREVRQQLLYIIELVESDQIEQALQAEEKEQQDIELQESKENDAAGKSKDNEGNPMGLPTPGDEEGGDIPPETDVHELAEYRESHAAMGTRQGENLLVYAYSHFYDHSERKSPSLRKSPSEPKSPVMKLVDSMRLPEELLSKPRLIYTPSDVDFDKPFTLGDESEAEDSPRDDTEKLATQDLEGVQPEQGIEGKQTEAEK